LSVVKVCLAGGLGNQLFQYVFSISLARAVEAKNVEVYTSRLSWHSTARDFELSPFWCSEIADVKLTLISSSSNLINLRIPKVLYRLGLTNHEFTRVAPTVWISDGYFQKTVNYQAVFLDHVLEIIAELRNLSFYVGSARRELVSVEKRRVVHIRCTDFYFSEQEAITAVKARLLSEDDDCIIVTDDDVLVLKCLETLSGKHRLLRTKGWSAFEMFQLFRNAKSISTNGSTLAFWGALLGAEKFQSTNSSHQELFKFMNQREESVGH